MKERIAAAKILAISHIKVACGGLLIDSPTAAGGNANTGPVARRFFSSDNREAICSIIDEAEDRYNYGLLLEQINICLAISESVDPSKILDVEKFKEHCFNTMLHICLYFPLVQISPTVHQMLAHNWELFQIMNGGPIARWSESGLEAWNKHKKFSQWCWLSRTSEFNSE